MSRALRLVEALFWSIGTTATRIQSLRLRSAEAGVEVVIGLSELSPDDVARLRRIRDGSELAWVRRFDQEGELLLSSDDELPDQTSELRLCFRGESTPTLPQFRSTLVQETALGLPYALIKGSQIRKMQLFYGASGSPLSVGVEGGEVVHLGQVRTVLNERSGFGVEFTYLRQGRLQKVTVPAEEFLSEENRATARRLKFKPERGFSVAMAQDTPRSSSPYCTSSELQDRINKLFRSTLQAHTRAQVARIDRRVKAVAQRRRVIGQGNQDLGVEPANEVETVLLLERMTARGLLPFSIEIQVLEYSPRDIDSICQFRPSPGSPSSTLAVEFEYSLENFFLHGHSPQQVGLIICYKAIPFPYDHEGHVYTLDRRKDKLPRLVCQQQAVEIPCLIISEVINVK